MMKRWAIISLIAALVMTAAPVFGSSENSTDRILSVKDDYEFKPGNAVVYLTLREDAPNDFASGPVSFRLGIRHGEWFQNGSGSGPDRMAVDTVTNGGLSSIAVQRLGDSELEITLTRGGLATEEAWWRIPLYAKVNEAGVVSVQVDGRDGLVTSGSYDIATVPGGNNLYAGYRFTPENPQWITFKEPTANSYQSDQTFRLVLDNGTWFDASEERLGPQAMLKGTVISGIEAGRVSKITRIDGKTLELTLTRGAASSRKAVGMWSVPLYFSVDRFGEARVTVQSQGSGITEGTLGTEKAVMPIRYVRTVTLTLDSGRVTMQQAGKEAAATLDVAPYNPQGSVYVPVRGVFEQLGAVVLWNGAERTATILSEDARIVLHADSGAATVNGKAAAMSPQPRIVNGRLMIPLRAVSEQLGFGVEWTEATRQITIRQD